MPTQNDRGQAQVDAILARRRQDAFVLVNHDEEVDAFRVDIINYEALGLYDTRSLTYPTFEEADTFARELAALLRLDIERVL